MNGIQLLKVRCDLQIFSQNLNPGCSYCILHCRNLHSRISVGVDIIFVTLLSN